MAMVLGGGSRWRVPKHQDVETIRNYEAILLFQLWIAFFLVPRICPPDTDVWRANSRKAANGKKTMSYSGGQNGWLAARKKGRERLGDEFDSTNANT